MSYTEQRTIKEYYQPRSTKTTYLIITSTKTNMKKEFTMKQFDIQVNYQPLNKLYGALIKLGNVTVFEVDKDIHKAIKKATISIIK